MRIILQILLMYALFKMKNINYLLLFIFINLVFSKHQSINSGPMVGYSTKREVALWIQTTQSVDVKFEYWEATSPTRFSLQVLY